MADANKFMVAPKTALVSKGIILGEGEEVTVENFANDKVFEKLKKAKKIVTEADFIAIQKKLSEPKTEVKAETKKESGKQSGKTESEKSEDKAGA